MNDTSTKTPARVTDPEDAAVVKLDETIERAAALFSELGKDGGAKTFSNAIRAANAIATVKRLLTPEKMESCMALQNSRLGFLTDNKAGYSQEVVKDALLEMTLKGLELCGNQFNILGGRPYVTKEGMMHLLATRVPGLKGFGFDPAIPVLDEGGRRAKVVVKIEWKMQGEAETRSETRPFVVRVNAGMLDDAIQGKAERKAAGWLYKRLTGIDAPDGEVSDGARPVRDITPGAERDSIARARAAAGLRTAAAEEEATFVPGGDPAPASKPAATTKTTSQGIG